MVSNGKGTPGTGQESIVFLVSGVLLAHQIVLLRQLALAQWAHVGYLVVGVALAGFGVAGVAVAQWGKKIVEHGSRATSASTVLFAASLLGGYLFLHWFRFDTEALAWRGLEVAKLALVSVVLSLPFFFGATVIALAFVLRRERVGRLYAMNLFGSALGALGGLALYAHGVAVVLAAGVGAGIVLAGVVRRKGLAAAGCGLGLVFLSLAAGGTPGPRMSESKDLARLLRQEGSQLLGTFRGMVSQIDVIDPGVMPVRYAPGLSMVSTAEVPEQLVVTRDGSTAGVLTRYGSEDELAFLDWTPAALALRCRRGDRLAILGIGAGYDALFGRYYGMELSGASEVDGSLVRFVQEEFPLLAVRRGVTETSARKFAESSQERERYDVIILGEGTGERAGLSGTQANFSHTVEAYGRVCTLLGEKGILSITVPTEDPPRSGLRVIATLARAAQDLGDGRRGRAHILAVRSQLYMTVLYSARPWGEGELAGIRRFCEARRFDLVWLPDMRPDEANRFMRYTEQIDGERRYRAKYYEAAREILTGDAERFFQSYPFDVGSVTDDRPFWHHHFRWAALKQILEMGRLGIGHLEFGYVSAVAFLAVIAVVAVIGTGLPLVVGGRGARVPGWAGGIGYFLAIGIAYMMVEMTTMYRIERAVGHPVLALAVTVSGFLFWSGLGSLASDRLDNKRRTIIAAGLASGILTALSPGTMGVEYAMGLAPAGACVVVFAGIGPLALAMGMMFPSGLAHFGRGDRRFIGWAYGANGFASVLAGAGTVLVAMAIGMRWTLAIAGATYFAAVALGAARKA